MRTRVPTSWIAHDVAPNTVRHIVDVRGTIQLLRLVGLGIVFWYERIVFLYQSLQCSPWNSDSITNPTPHASSIALDAVQRLRQPHLVVTILADPQLIDAYSYDYMQYLPWPLSSTVYYIARWAADTYARKSYQAVVRSGGHAGSDAVVWLGDLLDRGRVALTSAADVEHYERDTHRFRGLFAERLPTIYLPGNHDIRIPLTQNPSFQQESRDSRERWLQEWGTWHDAQGRATWTRNGGREHLLVRPQGGPELVKVMEDDSHRIFANQDAKAKLEARRTVNARLPVFLNSTSHAPTHEIILVDALDLAGMLPATASAEANADWQIESRLRFPQTYKFVESIDPGSSSGVPSSSNAAAFASRDPMRILFSHIPLYRPPGTLCNRPNAKHGIHRESIGAIEQGVDQRASYQNTLTQPVTEWLLDSTSPTFAFSGDNHDHCEILHASPVSSRVSSTELTVKAFGMTGGVKRPGFARIALWWDADSQQSHANAIPCLLPDQIAIWTRAYPLALLSMAILLLLDRRFRFGAMIDRKYRDRMLAWRLTMASGLEDSAAEGGARSVEDDEWHLVEQGEQLVASIQQAKSDSDDETSANDGTPQSHLYPSSSRAAIALQDVRRSPQSLPVSPSGSNRIRFGRKSISSSHSTPKRGLPLPASRAPSSFEARALRELKLAAATGEAVALRSGISTELSMILSGPVLLWLWFQIF